MEQFILGVSQYRGVIHRFRGAERLYQQVESDKSHLEN